ncbi:MAG: Gfo/Idh/MocA family oxidoreductase [Kiritimatiellaeota bacterium]|nr:Gfo/Idh/MocA family oxidoreductase [Kiritimatiellota bacterium]
MNEPANLTRRDFLGTGGKAAATLAAAAAFGPTLLKAKPTGETIGVGCIGGDVLNTVLNCEGVKVNAMCDVYGPHRRKGVERCKNPDVKTYVDYRELLADKNVDAVVICAPDHWHCQMVLDAVKAGKDIYCEKGFSRTLEEAKQMRAALKPGSVVFQLGHQARQSACALQAKELIATGALGPITLVRTGRMGNTPPDHPIWRWYGYYNQLVRPDPAQVVKDVDWDLWLGKSPKIPFNERHFWHWRCYWRYGTGQAGDLLSHEMDFVQYVLGHGIPDTCACMGLNALLLDDREVPDTWNTTYQFLKLGRTVTFSGTMNTSIGQAVEICGKQASLKFDDIAHNVTKFSIMNEGFNTAVLPKGYLSGKTPKQPSHMQDFINCVRSRGTPKCSTEEAFIETATYLMSIAAFEQQRTVRWDAAKEEIV